MSAMRLINPTQSIHPPTRKRAREINATPAVGLPFPDCITVAGTNVELGRLAMEPRMTTCV